MPNPLVTVLIASKDRPQDLAYTLTSLREVDYPNLEVIVIDDGSHPPLQPVVRTFWPDAIYIREAVSAGQSQRRTEGFHLASGKYVLQLDDDSSLVDPMALSAAVALMEERSDVGILAFRIYNGQHLPQNLPAIPQRYVTDFVGCGALFRTAVIRQLGGYRGAFGGQCEEQELSLRVLKAGWAILFCPNVLIHHRVSQHSRNRARTWMRGVRNSLWTVVLHFPLRRVPIEFTWKLVLAFRDSVVHFCPHLLLQALGSFLLGLPAILKHRNPMTKKQMTLYDALRFRTLLTKDDFVNPPKCTWHDIATWFRTIWWNRPRSRPFWDRRPGGLGQSAVGDYEHNNLKP